MLAEAETILQCCTLFASRSYPSASVPRSRWEFLSRGLDVVVLNRKWTLESHCFSDLRDIFFNVEGVEAFWNVHRLSIQRFCSWGYNVKWLCHGGVKTREIVNTNYQHMYRLCSHLFNDMVQADASKLFARLFNFELILIPSLKREISTIQLSMQITEQRMKVMHWSMIMYNHEVHSFICKQRLE